MAWPEGSTQYLIKKVATGQKLSKDLTEKEAYEILKRILDGETTPMQTGAFFTAMRMKGESGSELAGFTRAVREKVNLISPKMPYLVDLGYPYDGKVRTDILIIGAMCMAAGAGVPVMLHGARNVPPKRGRTPEELLETLGIPVHLAPEETESFLQKTGIGYLSCRTLSPVLADFLEVPAEIGVRPPLSAVHKLINPAEATATVLGITHPPYLKTMSEAVACLGVSQGWVVKGIEGSMELSLVNPTTVVSVKKGTCETSEIHPKSYGLPEVKDSEFAQRPLSESAQETVRALEGKPSAWKDIFIWNAAFLIFASGKEKSLEAGLRAARFSWESRKALQVLEKARAAA